MARWGCITPGTWIPHLTSDTWILHLAPDTWLPHLTPGQVCDQYLEVCGTLVLLDLALQVRQCMSHLTSRCLTPDT